MEKQRVDNVEKYQKREPRLDSGNQGKRVSFIAYKRDKSLARKKKKRMGKNRGRRKRGLEIGVDRGG